MNIVQMCRIMRKRLLVLLAKPASYLQNRKQKDGYIISVP